MIRINSSAEETEFQTDPIEIDHPLWHGLKVVHESSFYSSLVSYFQEHAYIPVGKGLYADPTNKQFSRVWNLYQQSGKSVEHFQIDALRNSDGTIPKETKIAAAISLSKQDRSDPQLSITTNWKNNADEIAVIFTQQTKPMGKGSFGVVTKAPALLINPSENTLSETYLALKTTKDEKATKLFRKGMEVLNKIKGPGLVEPSIKISQFHTDGEEKEGWAMTPYTADLKVWSRRYRKEPLKIIKAFLTGFDGLKILQDHQVVLVDLKPQNILVMDKDGRLWVDINDFDGCFMMPKDLTDESLADFKKSLEDFSLVRTRYYSRKKETKQIKADLNQLKTMLKVESEKRDLQWKQEFSDLLTVVIEAVKQVQIYAWGWSLVTSLVGNLPYSFNDSLEEEIPEEFVEEMLAFVDDGLKEILRQALEQNPKNRPSLETFRNAIREFLKDKEVVMISGHDHAYERAFNVAIPLKPLLGKGLGG